MFSWNVSKVAMPSNELECVELPLSIAYWSICTIIQTHAPISNRFLMKDTGPKVIRIHRWCCVPPTILLISKCEVRVKTVYLSPLPIPMHILSIILPATQSSGLVFDPFVCVLLLLLLLSLESYKYIQIVTFAVITHQSYM